MPPRIVGQFSSHYTPASGMTDAERAAIVDVAYNQSHGGSDARGYPDVGTPAPTNRTERLAGMGVTLNPEESATPLGFWKGFDKGANYSAESKPWGFTRSAIWHRAPSEEWQDLNPVARGGYLAGRIATDAAGFGSRSVLWRVYPPDLAGTAAMEAVKAAGGGRLAQVAGMAAAVNALDVGSNNVNLFNLGEAGRPVGFAATDPNPEDPIQTNNVPLEYFNRLVLGRTGRLLPWEQFHKERPDIAYETYSKYQDYLRDSGILGVVKGTTDGVDGPEARIMGYRVTPLGALGAAAAIGGTALAVKRLAGMRK